MTNTYECGTCGSNTMEIGSTYVAEHEQYEWYVTCGKGHRLVPTGSSVYTFRSEMGGPMGEYYGAARNDLLFGAVPLKPAPDLGDTIVVTGTGRTDGTYRANGSYWTRIPDEGTT